MPPPSPNAPLDRAAVDAAIAACLRAAQLVSALADARGRAAAVAREGWRGPARRRFDSAAVRLDLEAADLIRRLLGTAAALGDAALERQRADAAAWR